MKRNAVKTILFLLLTGFVLYKIQSVFCKLNTFQSYNTLTGFYELPNNSVDAVLIGSSAAYEFFQPPAAWEDHGIRVYSLTSPALPASAVKHWALEAHKTQPDALLILNLNPFRVERELPMIRYHNALDSLHFSRNKLELLRILGSQAEEGSLQTKLELYFPLIRFHSHWNDLSSETIYREPDGMMGAYIASETETFDYQFTDTEKFTPLSPMKEAALTELIKTIREEDLNVLFLITPHLLPEEDISAFNTLQQTVEAAGLPCLNLQKQARALTLDPLSDFHNTLHTNIHGALKVTEAVSQYLIDHYGFADRRQLAADAGTAAWEKADKLFLGQIADKVLDFELEHAPQLPDLGPAEAVSISAEADGLNLRLSWDAPANGELPDCWAVFRKNAGDAWERIGEVPQNQHDFLDSPQPGGNYRFNVVPFRRVDGAAAYGRRNNSGFKYGFFYPAPGLKELQQDENGTVVLRWDPVAEEKDYRVYRRQDGETWSALGDTKELWWEDKSAQPGERFSYAVSVLFNSSEGLRSETGLSITVK